VCCVERLQRFEVQRFDSLAGPGHALECRVVGEHGDPVARHVHVAFQDVRAHLERVFERGEGVLRSVARGTAVTEDGRGRHVEERVGHRSYVTMRPVMAVLTRDAILRELDRGRLVIDPIEPEQVGPASIDLTLGDEIRVIEPGASPIEIRDETDYRNHTTVRQLDGPFVLESGATIHGITRERIRLPPDLVGFLEGRSRFARLGLMIHVTSALVQPGVDNRQVLEMGNVSGHPLVIHAGVRICQLVLMRTEGEATYTGRFAQQDEI